jgi:hypothetical protein
MTAFQSNYARVVVRYNDPRVLEFTLTDRSFRIEILHRFDEKDPESTVDDILIDGSIGDVIHLLKTLGVDRVESAAKLLSVAGKLVIDSIPFNVVDAMDHLKTDPLPMTCFVSDVARDGILERLQIWRMDRDEE